MEITARKIEAVDRPLGAPSHVKTYHWLAWNLVPDQGCFDSTLGRVVGAVVRQQLAFKSHCPEYRTLRDKLLTRFPLSRSGDPTYLEELGSFCLTEGRSYGVEVQILAGEWCLRPVEPTDLDT